LQVIIPAASTVADAVKAHAARWPFKVHVVEGEADKLDAMRAAMIALACSGTVTTQLAVAGCPMVVGYRLAPLTHAILKRLIRTPWVTLFNVAAKDFVAPELIQDDCNGRALAREVALRLDDQTRRRDQISRQTAALTLMGKAERHPDEVAADAVLGLLTDPT
jgi:lipid-A-disaccharide synthase